MPLFNGISITELLELQKLRKSGAGIDVTKLNKGVTKKETQEGRRRGQRRVWFCGPGAGQPADESVRGPVARFGFAYRVVASDDGDAETKARRVVRTNNFTKQTNALDVDKHMWVLQVSDVPFIVLTCGQDGIHRREHENPSG